MIKKRFITTMAIALMAFLPFPAVAKEEKPETALLPEVAAIVLNQQQLNPKALEKDVYVGLLAISAPEGSDYMAVGG